MRKIFLLSILTFIVLSVASAQDSYKKNDVYIEVAGNGILGSLNYERQLTKKPGLGVRLGISVFPQKQWDRYYNRSYYTAVVPAGINYLITIKDERLFLDPGLGLTWTRNDQFDLDTREGVLIFMPSLGVRYHTRKDWMCRISFTSFAGFLPDNEAYQKSPWFGVSFGKRF